MVETCRGLDVPVSVERSRSGNGAHLWFSYDRLFPNQDSMPRGGFGNLIALPLQHEPRRHGNTLFLDDAFEPFLNQWSYLASIRRMDTTTVETIAREAARSSRVIGARYVGGADEENAVAPWIRAPSDRSRVALITEPLPGEVRAVLAQQLFVEKSGLPSALFAQIKRLAAFQNPEFYKKQRMRLSTATTPRVIACAEDLPNHIALPRGCRRDLEDLLCHHGIALSVEDQRRDGETLTLAFHGQLTPIQEQAAHALLQHDIGVLVAPPGVGKTVIGTYVTAARARSTLVLVHRQPLLDQWVAQLAMFAMA